MDRKDTRQEIPEIPDDRTIVISPDAFSASEKTSPENAAPEKIPPAASGASHRSILADLEDFLIPRRTVVDDTMELICKGGDDDTDSPRIAETLCAPPGDVAERYEIAAHPIAAGGQGKISRAVDRTLGCEVAMKSLHENLCPDERARESFLREARVTASLDHPAVVPIHGLFGDTRQGMHLAMKLISGHTLSVYLKNIIRIYEEKGIRRFDERKSLRNRIDIFLRVCDALEYAHARKIVHRDLKPENIMIGKHRETYVTDWGLAMRLEDAENLRKVDGTPAFIAPEVLTARRADVRSDVYSLGIILFELVTLSPAFSETDLTALLARVKRGEHAPLRHRFKCRIDADLKAIILKAISVDPEKRYQKVHDLAGDLRRYLANEETVARPDNLFSKICRWSVNHRGGMLVTTLLLLLLGIAGIARTLYKEMLWNTERRLREAAIGSVYGAVTAAANNLEKDMERIEYRLEQLRMNILFSALKIDVPHRPGGNFFVPLPTYRKAPPASLTYAPSYRHRIDPEGACVFNYLGKEIDRAALKYFDNTGEYMREALLDTRELPVPEAAVKSLLREGRPIKKIFFLLPDGTFVCYPGSRDDFPPGYYPPGRPWYRRAEKADGRLTWSKPYRDSGIHGESVITCSVMIRGMDRKFIGMGGIDYSLTKLAEKMLAPGSKYTPFTYEKMLVDPAGEVIFRMVPPERAGNPPFNDPALIRRMGKMKYGTLLTWKNGREMLLAFSCLDSIGTLYVEYLDMAALVENQRKNADDAESPGPSGVPPEKDKTKQPSHSAATR